MEILKTKITVATFAVLFAVLFSFGCGAQPETAPEKTTVTPPKEEIKRVEEKPSVTEVDVPKLANKSAEHFDEIFGDPVKISPVRNNPKLIPGEYREYKVEGHRKGLSVRFHRDKAKRFNLLLGKPEKTSTNALATIFKIDVKKLSRVQSDPLSETWKGKFGTVTFETAYAKRSKSSGEFIMLHAEVAN